jgi:beta-glucosidase-like glycosyl hydrolase
MGYDSVLSPRALREIYLMPFMLAQKYAKPWSIMTAYAESIFHETVTLGHDRQQSDTTVSMVIMRQKMLIFCATSSERNGNSTV